MLFSFFFLFWRIGESSRREDFLRARQRPRRNRIRSLSNLSIFIITITRYRGRSRFCFPSSSPSSRQNPIALRIFSNRIDRWREKIYINTFLAAHPEIDKKKTRRNRRVSFFHISLRRFENWFEYLMVPSCYVLARVQTPGGEMVVVVVVWNGKVLLSVYFCFFSFLLQRRPVVLFYLNGDQGKHLPTPRDRSPRLTGRD